MDSQQDNQNESNILPESNQHSQNKQYSTKLCATRLIVEHSLKIRSKKSSEFYWQQDDRRGMGTAK